MDKTRDEMSRESVSMANLIREGMDLAGFNHSCERNPGL